LAKLAEKKETAAAPEIDVLLRGMLSQPGVEGFMVFNEVRRARARPRGGAARGQRRLPSPAPASPPAPPSPPRAPSPRAQEGIPIKWSSSGFSKPGAPVSPAPIPPAVIHHAALLGGLASKARMTMRGLVGDVDGEVSMLRLHTTASEIIVAPTADVTLVVVQKANAGAARTIVQAAEDAHAAALTEAASKKK